ncbi:hypothetical protein [Micromonospora sp. NPDC007230]|uniref:hypothetical protein n=1 Tax=Micromonospora sp. NPDC007230 TaxID=3364237 RepID=UPI0036BDFE8B
MTDLITLLRGQRVLPVLRLPTAAEARAATATMFGHGLRVVELTATTPDWASAVRDARRGAPDGTLVGLGTVTSTCPGRNLVTLKIITDEGVTVDTALEDGTVHP